MERPAWVLLGDSLTQRGTEPGGWASTLAQTHVRAIDFFNRGYSGYNTRWILHMLPGILGGIRQRVQLLTLWLGANDAALADGIRQARVTARCIGFCRMDSLRSACKNPGECVGLQGLQCDEAIKTIAVALPLQRRAARPPGRVSGQPGGDRARCADIWDRARAAHHTHAVRPRGAR